MVTYHYVKFYVSIIIHLEVININVRNFNFPIGFYSNSYPLWTPQNMTLTPFTTKLKTLGSTRNISITPQSFMKFCPVVPVICCGQVHGPRKERRKRRIIRIIIIIRNGAKTISLPNFGRLNNMTFYWCQLWTLLSCHSCYKPGYK